MATDTTEGSTTFRGVAKFMAGVCLNAFGFTWTSGQEYPSGSLVFHQGMFWVSNRDINSTSGTGGSDETTIEPENIFGNPWNSFNGLIGELRKFFVGNQTDFTQGQIVFSRGNMWIATQTGTIGRPEVNNSNWFVVDPTIFIPVQNTVQNPPVSGGMPPITPIINVSINRGTFTGTINVELQINSTLSAGTYSAGVVPAADLIYNFKPSTASGMVFAGGMMQNITTCVEFTSNREIRLIVPSGVTVFQFQEIHATLQLTQ